MERLEKYHRPYYAELGQNLERLRSSFGFVAQLSCHCMSAVGAPTHPDPGKDRPDFNLGNVNGKTSSKEFIEFVEATLKGLGYSVGMNFPYNGGELNSRFGDAKNGVESIMVEINKKLFMDTKTFKKTAGFDKIKADATKVLGAVIQYSLKKATK
jgi:N-formylglutamate deformylase